MEFRTAIGYDKHPLKKGIPFVLGGVRIPHGKGLSGHSDGDVLLHALVDALLGGAALGDIGGFFPDTDARWKGANSQIFLKKACTLLEKKKISITFVDIIVLAEKPKLSPVFESIRANLALLLHLPSTRISLKAKTGEKMGDIGKERAVAVFAAVTLKIEGKRK